MMTVPVAMVPTPVTAMPVTMMPAPMMTVPTTVPVYLHRLRLIDIGLRHYG